MKRRQLFEFNEAPWFPSELRDLVTDALHFAEVRFDLYRPAVSVLARLLDDAQADTIIDLCSGAGGAIVTMMDELRARAGRPLSLRLTDLYVNEGAARSTGSGVTYHREPIDARRVPPELVGVRTLFTSLHHFAPDQAAEVIGDAVRARAPIGVFEITERGASSIATSLMVPLGIWLTTPLMQPQKLSRYLFTYAIPIVPFANGWDGVVSSLRTYTTDELLALAQKADPDETFEWTAGRAAPERFGPTITWLTGTPRPR
jgi:hypothetical protein